MSSLLKSCGLDVEEDLELGAIASDNESEVLRVIFIER